MTYRDDLLAARMRREALERELREVRGRMVEFDRVSRQADALERELAQCARDLEQARAKAELPLLPLVRVASPCKERWADMAGDEHVRFCGRCEKNVYDLSSLSASQAESLLRERGESMCVRFFRRKDGTILTSDCPVGARRKRVWRRVTGAAVASGLAAAAWAGAGATIGIEETGEARPSVVNRHVEEMGALPVDVSLRMAIDSYEFMVRDMTQEIENAQTRLAAAATAEERMAIQQQLEIMRAQVEIDRQHLERLRQENERL